MRKLSSRRPEQRGAALVEMALSLIILLPLVFYGAYASETFMAGFKAQEGEISAAWHLTAFHMNNFLSPGERADRYERALQRTQNRVNSRLGDLNSYPGSTGAGRSLVATLSRFNGVTCQEYTAAPIELQAFAVPRALPDRLENRFAPGGNVGCRASVSVQNVWFDRRLFKEYGQRELLKEAISSNLTLCGIGRDLQGCTNAATDSPGFNVLTDDWSLSDGSHMVMASTPGAAGNRQYYLAAESIYEAFPSANGNAGGTGSNQVENMINLFYGLANGDHIDTSRFKMGYFQVNNPRNMGNITAPGDRYGTSPTATSGGGPEKAYLTPFRNDNQGSDFAESETVYDQRRDNSYLGHPDENFNQ